MAPIIKLLAAGAVVVFAVAVSAAPSDAAKKKQAKTPACSQLASCSTGCKGNTCELRTCGPDGKWYLPVLSRVCQQPNCPKKC